MPKAKKDDFADMASKGAAAAKVEVKITPEKLLEACPKEFLSRFKAAKTPAARADLLYSLTENEWKERKKNLDVLDKFLSVLEQWFIQEFKDDQRGVTGKQGRVEVKDKEVANVEDWDKLYAHILKAKAFSLLNRALNQKAVKERWEVKKNVPGVKRFIAKTLSLTSVKGGSK